MRLVKSKFFILFFLAFQILNAQAPKVQRYKALVNDFTTPTTLSEGQKNALILKLRAYEDSTSTQIGIVLENTLQGRPILERAINIARDWGIGQKGVNNGVLIYIAKNDRKYKILTADKTQGRLTDGIVGQIGRDYLVPAFRANDYYTGLDNATTAIIKVLAGEFKASDKPKNEIPGWVIFIIIILIILFLSSRGGGGSHRGYRRGGTYWFPTGPIGGGGSNWGGGGSSWGGFGGGGGFNGGGAGGSW